MHDQDGTLDIADLVAVLQGKRDPRSCQKVLQTVCQGAFTCFAAQLQKATFNLHIGGRELLFVLVMAANFNGHTYKEGSLSVSVLAEC